MARAQAPAVSEDALRRAEQFVEEEEGAANKLKGWLGAFVRLAAFVMAAFHLYTAYAIVPTQTLRPVHVAFVLFLCFLVFPVARAIARFVPRLYSRHRGPVARCGIGLTSCRSS